MHRPYRDSLPPVSIGSTRATAWRICPTRTEHSLDGGRYCVRGAIFWWWFQMRICTNRGFWPSRFNPAHRWTFTIHKHQSWSPNSLNLGEMVMRLPEHRVVWLRTCDYGYDYTGGVWDRTGTPAEVHIEALLQKVGKSGLSLKTHGR